MTGEQWEQLVHRLEPQARANPRGYERKVALLGALGYVFIAASLLVLAALAGLVLYGASAGPAPLVKFLIPIGALALIIVRSLAVKLEPPEGVPLRAEDAPALFRMFDEVNESVGGPKVHEVLLDGNLNAGVVQIPGRGGIFGQRNYLVLGLPYMQALSPEEFRAVVAHELGHLSGKHGRFGAWVYRIHMTWSQLLHALEEKRHWGSGVFRRFFHWYAPYFEAYSYPLRRAHEFEADEAAAAAAGPAPAATSLLAAAVAGRYLDEEYWPALYRRAEDQHEPPAAFLPRREQLTRAREHGRAGSWLEQELDRPPAPHDTHPTTAERIRHLGLDPREMVSATRSNGASAVAAAQLYLGEAEAALTEKVDAEWRRAVEGAWSERYHEAQTAKSELAELDERASTEPLPNDEAYRRAELTEAFRGSDAALPLYQRLLEREPNDPAANFAAGRLLLRRGDEAGLAQLERAMELDPEAVLPACEHAFHFLTERGREGEAERYRARARGRYESLDEAQAERRDLSARGPFAPHALPPEAVDRLRDELARFPKLKRAYLVRKPMRHLDEEAPLHVLFVFPRSTLIGDLQKFVDGISADLSFDGWILSPSGLLGLKRWQLERIEGAKIYER